MEILPKVLEELANIENLYLNNCENLKQLGNLSRLKQLAISDYNLKQQPEELVNLTNLKILKLDCNNLRFLPDNIDNLQNLQKLLIEPHFWEVHTP